jgi:hypothetical protein
MLDSFYTSYSIRATSENLIPIDRTSESYATSHEAVRRTGLARSIPECDLGEGGISGMEQYAEAAEREDMLGERWWCRGL